MHAPHGCTWGGSCVLELSVPGDRPVMFLKAEAGQRASKDEPLNSGYVRIKRDSQEQGGGKQGWTGQDLFRNHFCSQG